MREYTLICLTEVSGRLAMDAITCCRYQSNANQNETLLFFMPLCRLDSEKCTVMQKLNHILFYQTLNTQLSKSTTDTNGTGFRCGSHLNFLLDINSAFTITAIISIRSLQICSMSDRSFFFFRQKNSSFLLVSLVLNSLNQNIIAYVF